MTFRKLQWLFPIAVTLHNGEEAIWMPGWAAQHVSQLHPPRALELRIVLLALALAAFSVTYLSSRRGPQSVWAYLLFGYIVAMLINVFVPHLPAALMFHSYAPGVVTSVSINLPLMSCLIWKALHDRWVSGHKAIAFGVCVPLLLGALVLTLFMM